MLLPRTVIVGAVLASLWVARDAAATWSLVIAVCGVATVAAVEQLAQVRKAR
jgi:hypothetical protein